MIDIIRIILMLDGHYVLTGTISRQEVLCRFQGGVEIEHWRKMS